MKYTITSKNEQIFIKDTTNPLHLLRTEELTDILALHEQIGKFLAQHKQVTYITTEQAMKKANDAGYTIPWKTINSACVRGTIPNAQKRAGRWILPELSFDAWLNAWIAKR